MSNAIGYPFLIKPLYLSETDDVHQPRLIQ